LEFFGFVLDKNDENYLQVGVSLDHEDRLYGNKKEKLHKKGLKDGQSYKIKADKLPPDLIYALRIYHTTIFDYEDIDNALKGKGISSQNELKVANMLVDLCQETLKNYPTTPKEDKALLKTELKPRHRAAVLLRRGEKRILSQTLNTARSAVDHVKKNWNYRTMDIPGEHMRTTLVDPSEEIL